MTPRETSLSGRRGFLRELAAGSLAGYLSPELARALASLPGPEHRIEVKDYDRLPEKRIQCFVCPLECVLEDGETCFCRTRTNHSGVLYSHAYANPCIVTPDPIEKTPLHHFRPGTRVLSLGTGGCNLRCIYCQNWQESQARPDRIKTIDLPPAKVAPAIGSKGIDTVAFTYTEPVAFLEYVEEIVAATRPLGIKNVMATAAFALPKPFRRAVKAMDAVVVALKGFRNEFYEKTCGVSLPPVLDAIEAVAQTGTWFEITTLLVPGYNDGREELDEMFRWIVKVLGKNVPLHLARFVPAYRLKDVPMTPLRVMEDARRRAQDAGLRYVYLSNLAPHEGNNTYCDRCGKLVIERLGFKVLKVFLRKDRCRCGHRIPGIFA